VQKFRNSRSFRLQICATLYEWEHIAERFDKATHYSEKALYKVLANDVVPSVTEELRVRLYTEYAPLSVF
jgi:hypothetical protein